MKNVRTVVTVLAAAALLAAGSGLFACKKKEPETIKIGAILPLTGDNAKYGIWIKEALELKAEEVNSAGGINGKEVEIIYEDDQVNPKYAAAAMTKLAEVDKVPVVYGSWASSSVLAQAPIAERTHTVVMAQAISPKIRDAGDYVFRCIPGADYSLSELVPFAVKEGALKVAIIYVNNDYGLDQAEVFKTYLEEAGGEVVFEEGYDLETTDFRTVLLKLKALDFDAVYLPGYTEVGLILRQMQELGIECQRYSSDPFENEDVLKVAGEAAEGVYFPSFFVAETATGELKGFVNRYKAKYGREPEGNAALAYNGISIVFEALRRTGIKSENIKEELYKFLDFQAPLGNVSVDKYGDIRVPIYIKTVDNGKFVPVGK